ncbi:XRE family transcriptional regulator [Paenibacillus sp. N4]|uniref:helix-turn-helix domain-containing protein n=1 Tax=Paenibacillus vietnamensis TaxID=2590547 RepID=UPI001CD124B8|nr:XRE family transcriptional regulator [Paenibacillus vietnamensis]MCA0756307.1 XRE family transcriptional regulator [Paenibacillus vietnamensis]
MNIGSAIRTIRKRKNITITQICEETGLSQGFMSQVENNKTSPSIATLESIANALKVPLAYLLLRQEERMSIVRKEERRITKSGIENLKVEHLSSTKNVRMRLVEFPPGASTGDVPHAHEGEEVHFVVKGKIYAQQGEDKAEFGEGDSFSWNACTPHLVRNISEETAIVLIAIYSDSENSKDFL